MQIAVISTFCKPYDFGEVVVSKERKNRSLKQECLVVSTASALLPQAIFALGTTSPPASSASSHCALLYNMDQARTQKGRNVQNLLALEIVSRASCSTLLCWASCATTNMDTPVHLQRGSQRSMARRAHATTDSPSHTSRHMPCDKVTAKCVITIPPRQTLHRCSFPWLYLATKPARAGAGNAPPIPAAPRP